MTGAWKWYALGAVSVAALSYSVLIQAPPPPSNPPRGAPPPPSGWVVESFYVLKAPVAGAPETVDLRTDRLPVPIDPAGECKEAFALPQFAERANRAVVRVVVEERSKALPEYRLATGTVVAPEGFVLTVYHVVASLSSPPIEILWNDGRKGTAEIFKVDPSGDLALLKIRSPEGVRFPYLPLANEAYTAANPIYRGTLAVRFGYGHDASHRHLTGACAMLGSPILFRDIQRQIKTSVPWDENRILDVYEGVANEGDSGSPILDKRGFVVDVLFSNSLDKTDPVFVGTRPSNSATKLGLK